MFGVMAELPEWIKRLERLELTINQISLKQDLIVDRMRKIEEHVTPKKEEQDGPGN